MREVGDEVDRANELAEMETANSLYLARKKAAPEREPDANGNYPDMECVDCGGEIAAGRLRLGKVRCIGCQTELERRARR